MYASSNAFKIANFAKLKDNKFLLYIRYLFLKDNTVISSYSYIATWLELAT